MLARMVAWRLASHDHQETKWSGTAPPCRLVGSSAVMFRVEMLAKALAVQMHSYAVALEEMLGSLVALAYMPFVGVMDVLYAFDGPSHAVPCHQIRILRSQSL